MLFCKMLNEAIQFFKTYNTELDDIIITLTSKWYTIRYGRQSCFDNDY